MRPVVILGALGLGLAVIVVAGCGSSRGSGTGARSGESAGSIDVRFSTCGGRWAPARGGQVNLTVTNHYSEVAEVYLANARTGAVYDELEGLAPGATSSITATLGSGRYRLQCYTEENPTWLGPVIDASTTAGPSARTPGVVPVTFGELVGPTKAYQAWITSRLPVLLRQVKALGVAVASGATAEAKAAWLTAHVTYETLGAAYDAFGPLDDSINGFPPGSESWREDHSLTGFHLIEGLLWSGAPASKLVPAVVQLRGFVQALIQQFVSAEIQPADLPLRAHEIVENAIQFELTGQTDEGSHTNLATVEANLAGSAKALSFVAPLMRSRYPQLAATEHALAASERLVGSFDHDGQWTPLESLSQLQRERIDASVENLAELLAPVAAIGDIRNTPASAGL